MKVNLADRLQVGSTSLKLPPMGFGAAHLGGMHRRVPGDVARATLCAAWDGGIRHFDTAPFYGLGLSEHRLGEFLIDQPRAEFIVTTKVGRVLHRPADPRHFDLDNGAADSILRSSGAIPMMASCEHTSKACCGSASTPSMRF